MRIIQNSPLPSIKKLKNKEDFCERIIQEVVSIIKENKICSKTNDKISKLTKIKNKLILKNEKLESLIEKSLKMKNDLNEKINSLIEENNSFKKNLINVLQGHEHK